MLVLFCFWVDVGKFVEVCFDGVEYGVDWCVVVFVEGEKLQVDGFG